MKELIEEILFELLQMTVDELEQFGKEWETELEKNHASEYAKSICTTLIDAVIEQKRGAAV